MVDKRRDPNADTGLFQLVYKQNFPRIPAYLGLNLAVRGRKVFRNRSRTRTDKEKKEKEKDRDKPLNPSKKHEYFKEEYIKKLPTLNSNMLCNSPKSYKGPVIEDLIEELHKSVGGNEGDTVVITKTIINKKNSDGRRAERVPKKSSYKCNTNKTNSFYRRQNAKENFKKPCGQTNESNYYFGVFNEWSLKSKITSECSKLSCEDIWEKETVSILKGTNILNKFSTNTTENDTNKNCFRPQCLATFDLNKLLPHINANNVDDSDKIIH